MRYRYGRHTLNGQNRKSQQDHKVSMMELSASKDTIVHVQPAGIVEEDERPRCQMDEYEGDCCESQKHDKYNADQGACASTSCPRKCEETCIPVPNVYVAQETVMLEEQVKDSRSLAIQKVRNVMRNMQQTHIAELFPIMDSRETTEGSEEQIICRICHTGGEEVLIAPCKCIGSTQFVHATCLLTWFKKSVKNQCELCQHSVPIRKKTKPVSEWKKPEDKPIPLIWFMVFFVGLCLNILSIHVNASESCKSTACLIFYVVNGFGIVLDAAFLWFWWLKCMMYWKKWCAINQDWFITDTKHCYIPTLLQARKNKSQEVLNPVYEIVETGHTKEAGNAKEAVPV